MEIPINGSQFAIAKGKMWGIKIMDICFYGNQFWGASDERKLNKTLSKCRFKILNVGFLTFKYKRSTYARDDRFKLDFFRFWIHYDILNIRDKKFYTEKYLFYVKYYRKILPIHSGLIKIQIWKKICFKINNII